MSDTTTIILALITATVSLGTALISAFVLVRTTRIERRTAETHDLVNGKMTELTEALTGKATAEGFTLGEQTQRERQAPNGER